MQEIKEVIYRIFQERFEMDVTKLGPEGCDKHLLGREIGLAPRDLLYLYFDLEKEYNITFPQEEVAAGKFSTINNITELVVGQLQKMEVAG